MEHTLQELLVELLILQEIPLQQVHEVHIHQAAAAIHLTTVILALQHQLIQHLHTLEEVAVAQVQVVQAVVHVEVAEALAEAEDS